MISKCKTGWVLILTYSFQHTVILYIKKLINIPILVLFERKRINYLSTQSTIDEILIYLSETTVSVQLILNQVFSKEIHITDNYGGVHGGKTIRMNRNKSGYGDSGNYSRANVGFRFISDKSICIAFANFYVIDVAQLFPALQKYYE